MPALTLFPLQFQRQDHEPVDIDFVFTSTTARSDYLTSPRRYAGQIATDISSGECKAYILNTSKNAWIPIGAGGVSSPFATPSLLGTVYGCTTSYGNSSFGYAAYPTITGCNNIAVGYASLLDGVNVDNISIGNCSMCSMEAGCQNVSIGARALSGACRAYANTSIGAFTNSYGCGCGGVIQKCNTAIGNLALYGNCYGCSNTALGNSTGIDDSVCNATYIGNCVHASGSNLIKIGRVAGCLRAPISTITAFSDCRDKTNICSIPIGLEFINALRPVKFQWNDRKDSNRDKKIVTEPGFIAQELDQVVQQFDAEWLQLVDKSNPDEYYATVGRLLPVAIKAIQELADRVDVIKSKIN